MRERREVNPTRLAELERQRDLVREQLAWLEREIARESGNASRLATPSSALVAQTLAPSITTTANVDATVAAIAPLDFGEYQPDPVSAATSARRGCVLTLIAVVGIGAVILAAFYFFHYRDHPLLFVPHGK